MTEFVERKHDVLLCTAIIESGLDIPSANTILVDRADGFGLSQLYQIRGRVGRSRERAYAYLLIPARRKITRDAQKRLQVLQQFTELGAGFQGLQLMAMGILGEYLGRLFMESKRRPLYLLDEYLPAALTVPAASAQYAPNHEK